MPISQAGSSAGSSFPHMSMLGSGSEGLSSWHLQLKEEGCMESQDLDFDLPQSQLFQNLSSEPVDGKTNNPS